MKNEQIKSIIEFEDLLSLQVSKFEQTGSCDDPPADIHDRFELRRTAIKPLAEEVLRLRDFAWFDRLDHDHKPTHVLRLLNEGEISLAKACEWLRAYAAGNEMPLVDVPVGNVPDDMSFADVYAEMLWLRQRVAELEFGLCSDCPPVGYPHDRTRCEQCPRKAAHPGNAVVVRVEDRSGD